MSDAWRRIVARDPQTGRVLARPLADRFTDKVDRSGGPDACWPWTGDHDSYGYGRIRATDGPARGAHRVAYELLVGPIPKGLQLDHLCRNRGCVNPAHLQAVTQAENLRRSPLTIGSIARARTACIHGHEFTPENTGITRVGTRRCRTCHRLDERRRHAMKRRAA